MLVPFLLFTTLSVTTYKNSSSRPFASRRPRRPRGPNNNSSSSSGPSAPTPNKGNHCLILCTSHAGGARHITRLVRAALSYSVLRIRPRATCSGSCGTVLRHSRRRLTTVHRNGCPPVGASLRGFSSCSVMFINCPV